MSRPESLCQPAVGSSEHPDAGVACTASSRPQGPRLPYERPALRTLNLAAEEVLAVGCKLSTAPGGPIGATCTAASCFAEGS